MFSVPGLKCKWVLYGKSSEGLENAYRGSEDPLDTLVLGKGENAGDAQGVCGIAKKKIKKKLTGRWKGTKCILAIKRESKKKKLHAENRGCSYKTGGGKMFVLRLRAQREACIGYE